MYSRIRQERAIRTFTMNGREETISCQFLTKLPPGNKNPYFDHYCGLLVLKGTGTYTDWHGKTVTIGPGDYCQHIPGKHHWIRRDDHKQFAEVSVSISNTVFDHLVSLGSNLGDQGVWKSGITPGVMTRFETLINNLRNLPERRLGICTANVHLLFVEIEAAHTGQSPDEDPQAKLIEGARTLVSQAGRRKPDFKAYADAHGVSYTHFRRLFKEHTGQSPNQYRIQSRIHGAQWLLIQEELSVKEVAYQLGYPNAFAFSKQFKDVMGQSPQDFLAARTG